MPHSPERSASDPRARDPVINTLSGHLTKQKELFFFFFFFLGGGGGGGGREGEGGEVSY